MNGKETCKNQRKHSITVNDRGYISLTGIEEVLSFDENNIVMQSTMGQITLDGSTLNIVKLNLENGEVDIEGKLDAFYYMEQRKSSSVFSRLFK